MNGPAMVDFAVLDSKAFDVEPGNAGDCASPDNDG